MDAIVDKSLQDFEEIHEKIEIQYRREAERVVRKEYPLNSAKRAAAVERLRILIDKIWIFELLFQEEWLYLLFNYISGDPCSCFRPLSKQSRGKRHESPVIQS